MKNQRETGRGRLAQELLALSHQAAMNSMGACEIIREPGQSRERSAPSILAPVKKRSKAHKNYLDNKKPKKKAARKESKRRKKAKKRNR